jgi:hypothetical protein
MSAFKISLWVEMGNLFHISSQSIPVIFRYLHYPYIDVYSSEATLFHNKRISETADTGTGDGSTHGRSGITGCKKADIQTEFISK